MNKPVVCLFCVKENRWFSFKWKLYLYLQATAVAAGIEIVGTASIEKLKEENPGKYWFALNGVFVSGPGPGPGHHNTFLPKVASPKFVQLWSSKVLVRFKYFFPPSQSESPT